MVLTELDPVGGDARSEEIAGAALERCDDYVDGEVYEPVPGLLDVRGEAWLLELDRELEREVAKQCEREFAVLSSFVHDAEEVQQHRASIVRDALANPVCRTQPAGAGRKSSNHPRSGVRARIRRRVTGHVADALHRTPVGRKLRGRIQRQLGTSFDVDDVLHEGFLRLLESVWSIDAPSRALHYLYGIVRSLCTDGHRRAGCHERSIRALATTQAVHEDPRHRYERLDGARRAYRRLPSELRVVFSMQAAGASIHEISRALDLTIDQVKKRLRSAKLWLRRRGRA